MKQRSVACFPSIVHALVLGFARIIFTKTTFTWPEPVLLDVHVCIASFLESKQTPWSYCLLVVCNTWQVTDAVWKYFSFSLVME